jgi:hypothetical protein
MIRNMDRENEKQLRQRQERIARQREVAVERVADLEYQLDAIASQLDQFDRLMMQPPTMMMLGGGLFSLGGQRRPRRGRF